MTLTKQNIDYIRRNFSKMKTQEDFLAVVNYAKSLTVSIVLDLPQNVLERVYYDTQVTVADALAAFSLDLLDTYASHKNISSHYERYETFTIKKKSGGDRLINAPIGNLKLVQRCLNVIFQSIFHPHKSATGFVPNKSVVDNARVHTGNNFGLN